MRYYFNRSFLTLTVGASLLVSSCVSLADMSNAMNSDQRDALECKAALETFASAHGHEVITQAHIDNPPRCTVTKPDDADIVHTGYYHSHGILRFTTGQSMQTFGAKYHQLLGLGEATGRVALENGLSGKFAGVDYSLMYRQDLAVYEIGWVPPVVPGPKED